MPDITKEPYAEWLEACLANMVDLKPRCIALVVLQEDGTAGTSYYNADSGDRWTMVRAMIQDNVLDFIRVNADLIGEILRGEEDEEADP